MFLQRNEHTGGLAQHPVRQPIRRFQTLSGPDERLQRKPRQLYDFALGGFDFLKPHGLRAQVGFAEAARFVRTCGFKGSHRIPNAEGSFVGQKLRAHRLSIQRARHDLEAAGTASGGRLIEFRRDQEDVQVISACHRAGDAFVVHRAFRREAVGAVRGQLVGQIAAGEKHRLPPGRGHSPGDGLAQPVMVHRRKPRKANPHDSGLRTARPHHPERHKGAVVKRLVALALGSRRDACLCRFVLDGLRERLIILGGNRHPRRAKARHVAVRALTGGDVEVVRVGGGVGGQDHDHLRIERADLLPAGLKRADG